MNRRPLLIDCDTGTDDAIAIIAAVGCEDIDIKAITSVNGNVPVDYVTNNNIDLLEYIGRSDIPVARGADGPFYARPDYYGLVHGERGMGDLVLPQAKHAKESPINAIDTIKLCAHNAAGELEILSIGPMTNLAMALLIYPQIKKKIKHIWFMGGAIKGGNMSSSAEFNIWVDPIAAKRVMASGIPMTMVGLDVTEKAIMTHEDEEQIRAKTSQGATIVADIIKFMFKREQEGGEGAVMHDALALAAAVCPDCLEFEDYFVDTEVYSQYTSGHTEVDYMHLLKKEPNVSVATKIDVDRFRRWLVSVV